MLLRQQRGGHEDGHLHAVLHGLKGSADGHLGFAVAHIADDDAVHRHRGFHVLLDGLDSQHLIFGFDEREIILHLRLPRIIRGELVPRRGLALGVELDQLAGDFAHGGACLLLGVLPVGTAHLGQVRRFATGVLAEQIQRVHGNPELIGGLTTLGGRVLEHDVFAAAGFIAGLDGALGHLEELADAVGLVHHKIALLEGERVNLVAALGGPALRFGDIAYAVTGQIRLGYNDQWEGLGVLGLFHLGKYQAGVA